MSPVRVRPCSSPRRVNIACAFTTSGHAVAMSTSLSENRAPRTVSEASCGGTLIAGRGRVPRCRLLPDVDTIADALLMERVARGHGADPPPHGGVDRHPKRSLEEAARRGTVLPAKGSLAGVLEAEHRSPRDGRDELAGLAELRAIAVRLLQVVADDLLELGEPVAGGRLEPVGEALVEARPRRALGSASYAASRISRWRNR